MFNEGQEVICMDDDMGGIGKILEKGKSYKIKDFVSADDCQRLFPDSPAKFHKNGGRVEVVEFAKCHWYGRRFKTR